MPPRLLSIFSKKTSVDDSITVVSGLPRSGTSMMMQILEAGGMKILTDRIREADRDNPKGYYEFERVKKLKEGDFEWLKDARGKAVKIISALLEYLPPQYHYKIIFMQRDYTEILASQKQMLIRLNQPTDKVSDEELAELFKKHIFDIQTWLGQQKNMEVLYIRYDELIKHPQPHLDGLVKFLNMSLNLQSMIEVPDKTLYRQRR